MSGGLAAIPVTVIPTTASGKITHSAYLENYRDERFVRLDV